MHEGRKRMERFSQKASRRVAERVIAKRKEERQEQSITSSKIGIVEAIQKIAAKHARADLDSEADLLLYLRSWWSKTFELPLKDPLLSTYSLEDLLYEFFIRSERKKSEEEKDQAEADRIEEDLQQEDIDWAMEEERKDAEAMEASMAAKKAKEIDEKWMQDQIDSEKAKSEDEDFGDDIDMKF